MTNMTNGGAGKIKTKGSIGSLKALMRHNDLTTTSSTLEKNIPFIQKVRKC